LAICAHTNQVLSVQYEPDTINYSLHHVPYLIPDGESVKGRQEITLYWKTAVERGTAVKLPQGERREKAESKECDRKPMICSLFDVSVLMCRKRAQWRTKALLGMPPYKKMTFFI